MVWVDTKKFKDKMDKKKNKNFDLSKLSRWEKEGWEPKFGVKVPDMFKRLKYSRAIKLVETIRTKDIIFSAASGFSCQNCGLYNRHPFCSPDSPSYNESIEIIRGYKNAVIFVTQNDGNDPWSDNPTDLSHIEFKTRKGFGLKGAEAGTTRYLQLTMKLLEHHLRRMGLRSQAFISGHCELCGRCPVKGVRDSLNKQISCPLGGLPSLESWWQDLYSWYLNGSLGDVFKDNNDVLRPLTFVCSDYFTLITMVLYDSDVSKKYWYFLNYKNRLKTPLTKEKYKELSDKIKRSVDNRKSKNIPL